MRSPEKKDDGLSHLNWKSCSNFSFLGLPVTKFCKLSDLNNRNVLSQSSEGCKLEIKMLAGLVSSEAGSENVLCLSPSL